MSEIAKVRAMAHNCNMGEPSLYVTRGINTQLSKGRSGQTERRICRERSSTNAYNCTMSLNNNNKSNSNYVLPVFDCNIKRQNFFFSQREVEILTYY